MPIRTYATLDKQTNLPIACLGKNLTYTIIIENVNTHPLMDVMFYDAVPTGLRFVPESVYINADRHQNYNPNFGFSLPLIMPTQTLEVRFEVEAMNIPTDNPVTNIAHITFNTDTMEDGPVTNETAYSNPNTVTIRDCDCDEDSCETTLCKLYSISLPFTVKPFARKETPEIICVGDIELEDGHIPCQDPRQEFEYTLKQQIKVELPVAFGAEVCYEEPCAEDDGRCITP